MKILLCSLFVFVTLFPFCEYGCFGYEGVINVKKIDIHMKYRPKDRAICENLLQSAYRENIYSMPINELVIMVGRHFQGTGYAPRTLERKGQEDLIINLRKLDCFTFLENVVVMARLIRERKTTFEDYAVALQEVRYRKGVLSGYSSRLHYFCDWLHDNERKGMVRDITQEIGGQPFPKVINYMTANANKYAALKARGSYCQMRRVEDTLSQLCRYYIPKRDLKSFEDKIIDGDLIAITTGIGGLDVAHVGLAVRLGGRLHLLHASQTSGKVVISSRTLYGYLTGKRLRTGIIVARVL